MGKTVKVSDMIDEGVSVDEDGKVTGTIKYIGDFKDFSNNPEEQKGNFFPIELTTTGSKMTLKKNGVAGKGKSNLNFDKDIVFRVGQKTDTLTVEVDGKEVGTFSFNDATLQTSEETGSGRMTIMGQSEKVEKYGQKPVSELMGDDIHVAWNGTTGTVTGAFKKVDSWAELPSGTKSGHFFAMTLDKQYMGKSFDFIMDGKEPGTHTDSAGEDEMFWVLRIDKTKKFTFKSDNKEIMTLDFTNATLS